MLLTVVSSRQLLVYPYYILPHQYHESVFNSAFFLYMLASIYYSLVVLTIIGA